MTRRVSRLGRVYTEGSHRQLGRYPRTCSGCGRRVTLAAVWQETTAAGELRSWHHACRLARVNGGESEGAGV